jgi:alkyl hydroperoxide reductase subunit F
MRLIAILLCIMTVLTAAGCSSLPKKSEQSVRAPQAGTVAMYTRPGCPYCRQAKEYLTTLGIAVDERDISKDRQAQAELGAIYGRQLKGQRPIVPVLLVGDRVLAGFDPEELKEALDIWTPNGKEDTNRGQ